MATQATSFTCAITDSQSNLLQLTTMLEPLQSTFLGPIFSKSLRALPVLVQTGYLDAVTFCMSLRPPLLSFTPELLRLLQVVHLFLFPVSEVPTKM